MHIAPVRAGRISKLLVIAIVLFAPACGSSNDPDLFGRAPTGGQHVTPGSVDPSADATMPDAGCCDDHADAQVVTDSADATVQADAAIDARPVTDATTGPVIKEAGADAAHDADPDAGDDPDPPTCHANTCGPCWPLATPCCRADGHCGCQVLLALCF